MIFAYVCAVLVLSALLAWALSTHLQRPEVPKAEPKQEWVPLILSDKKSAMVIFRGLPSAGSKTITLEEVCYDGILYVLTYDGGITPKINREHAGQHNVYFKCGEVKP